MRICRLLLILVASLSVSLPAMASRSTEKEALALIKKAQEYVKKNGVEKSVIEFNRLDSPFNSTSDINPYGDLYVFSTDPKGFQLVHGKNPRIRNKVMIDMKDQDGVFLIQELVKACFQSKEERGWVGYRWPHPQTQLIEAKRAYVERVAGTDFCIGTGIYK